MYGLVYLIGASDPAQHGLIVLVGGFAKVFDPLGKVHALGTGALPWGFALHDE